MFQLPCRRSSCTGRSGDVQAAAHRNSGLTTAEALRRAIEFGPNALPGAPAIPAWRRFIRQFASPLIYLLLVALAFDLGLWLYEGGDGWPVEATAIALILLLNAGLGLYQEGRSEAALAHVQSLAGTRSWVLRDGLLVSLPTDALVPGDLVRLEAGDRIPADGVLVGPRAVMIDESNLTGESVPVDKGSEDEASSGTLLVRGRADLRITRTGRSSALGRLAGMLTSIDARATPLERRVQRLATHIARGVLILAAVLATAGIAAEGWARAPETIIFVVALAVAAVPEGLPAVMTVALAIGVERMARRKGVVRRLSAVEALGSVTVIATDKTGTLTENRMEVRSLDVPDQSRALRAIVLANDGDLATGVGDPLDLGLLRHAAASGVDIARERTTHPAISVRPFDSVWKFMRVTVTAPHGPVSYFKGAPEALFRRCTLSDQDRDSWQQKLHAYGRDGFRVLALATGEGDHEVDLTLLGLVLFWDPPRPEVPEAVRRAQAAGIRVIMITGDHPATALAVAHRVGIPAARVLTGEDLGEYEDDALREALKDVNVFARIQADQKLRLVTALQTGGAIVAMTGDGVNDAPALKRADVGIAMGQRGSDVTREVGDVVLLDDNFSTIVAAIEEGRTIFENIQKFLRFLFSTNLSELLLIVSGGVLAFFLNLRDPNGMLLLPLTAVQVLWINLVTDGLPCLALAFDRTSDVMQRPPRPVDASLLDTHSIRFVIVVSLMKTGLALVLLGVLPRLGYELETTRTCLFHFMAVGQLLLVYPSRHSWTHPGTNASLHLAVGLGIVAQVIAAGFPALSGMLALARLPVELWLVVFGGAFVAWAIAQCATRLVWPPAAALETAAV